MQFVTGILLARLFVSLTHNQERRILLHRLTFPVIIAAMTGFWWIVRSPETIPKPVLHHGGLLLLFGLLILVFAGGHPAINKLLSQPLLVLLSEASYGLYLLHIVLWHYLSHVVASPITGWNYVGYLVAAVALSIVSFRYFEQPARDWLNARGSTNSPR